MKADVSSENMQGKDEVVTSLKDWMVTKKLTKDNWLYKVT